jgi:hypothetical protein
VWGSPGISAQKSAFILVMANETTHLPRLRFQNDGRHVATQLTESRVKISM